MTNKDITYHPYVDYVQSANTLFHFMKEFGFLQTILLRRAIVPRYCIETVDYLNINRGNLQFSEVAVLQKCFCDIPLHKLADTFAVVGTGDNFALLNPDERFKLEHNNTHFDFYGKFAVGFSKNWCERNKLQPIHYLNAESPFGGHFQKVLSLSLTDTDLQDDYVEDVLYRLAYVKPLRGVMQRNFKRSNDDEIVVDIFKNFHDECEWRFVPDHTATASVHLENILANPKIISNPDQMKETNRRLEDDKYSTLWLRFDYDDIRYLIVPDNHYRIELIRAVLDIPGEMFLSQENAGLQKQILISKIMVLDEIRKDW